MVAPFLFRFECTGSLSVSELDIELDVPHTTVLGRIIVLPVGISIPLITCVCVCVPVARALPLPVAEQMST